MAVSAGPMICSDSDNPNGPCSLTLFHMFPTLFPHFSRDVPRFSTFLHISPHFSVFIHIFPTFVGIFLRALGFCEVKVGEMLQEVGHEYGTTTGRRRRCGWLDLALVKYSAMVRLGRRRRWPTAGGETSSTERSLPFGEMNICSFLLKGIYHELLEICFWCFFSRGLKQMEGQVASLGNSRKRSRKQGHHKKNS